MGIYTRVLLGASGAVMALIVGARLPGINGDSGRVSTDSGWSGEVKVSSTGGVSSGVIGRGLAIDSRNRLHVVWNEQGLPQRAYYARSTDGGSRWSTGRSLSDGRRPAYSPNIAVGPGDTLHVAWVEAYGDGFRRVRYSRSGDSGLSWTPARTISPAVRGLISTPSISVDTRNRIHVAWHTGNPDYSQPLCKVFYSRSTNGGSSFSSARQLNTGSGHAAWPRFSVEGTTGDVVAVAWRDNRKRDDWDVYVGVSADGGKTFIERIGVAGESPDWDPDVLVDADGVIHLAVMTMRPGGEGVTVDYQRSTDLGLTWSEQVTLSESLSRFPFWAPDTSGGILWLFWKDERDFRTSACPGFGRDRCADVAGKYSTDGGVSWSAFERSTDLGVIEVKLPSPAVGPDGVPHVVWSDTRGSRSAEALYHVRRLLAPAAP